MLSYSVTMSPLHDVELVYNYYVYGVYYYGWHGLLPHCTKLRMQECFSSTISTTPVLELLS